jgi:uncharacterized protein (DUF2267 family)
MTVPQEYKRASEQFEKFLVNARDFAFLQTTNQSYTMAQAVLQVFRRRLEIKDAILFASVLPVGLRALFVVDWNIEESRQPFDDRAAMTREVQHLRADHNISPDSAIRDVARALRQNVDTAARDRVLARLPQGAEAFWRLD